MSASFWFFNRYMFSVEIRRKCNNLSTVVYNHGKANSVSMSGYSCDNVNNHRLCRNFSGINVSCSQWKYRSVCFASMQLVHDAHRHNIKHFSNKQVITESDEHDIRKLAEDLLEEASKTDKMILTLSKKKIYKEVEALLNIGFKIKDLQLLYQHPNIIYNLPQLTEMLPVLFGLGLSKNDVSNLLWSYPDTLFFTKDSVSNVIKCLHDSGFTYMAIINMILNCPSLLDKQLDNISMRIEELKLLLKTKDAFKMAEKAPNLLFCDMDYINERFYYVFNEMGISQPQMRYARLFSYSMQHIHTRHMFLVRAGLFKKVKRKDGQLDLNPKLDTILDTTDEEFVKKFGKMTVQDYNTFKLLLQIEEVTIKKHSIDEESDEEL